MYDYENICPPKSFSIENVEKWLGGVRVRAHQRGGEVDTNISYTNVLYIRKIKIRQPVQGEFETF